MVAIDALEKGWYTSGRGVRAIENREAKLGQKSAPIPDG
jgi:hypothetical protein